MEKTAEVNFVLQQGTKWGEPCASCISQFRAQSESEEIGVDRVFGYFG